MSAYGQIKTMPDAILGQRKFPSESVDNPRLQRLDFFLQENKFVKSFYAMYNKRDGANFGQQSFLLEKGNLEF